MTNVRARRRSLADILDITDLDSAVEDLLDMNEQEFTRAVLLYLEGDRLGMDVMRDPYVIERTFDTIDRLLRQNRRRWSEGEHSDALSRLIESLDTERKAIREEATVARQDRIREQQAERTAAYAERAADRLARAAAKQKAAREELERAQRKSADARALERLKKDHLAEFLAIRREIKAQDAREAAAAAQTREDGAGAADPPMGATAPAVPAQAARV
jgi:hypothetical protein